MSWSERGRSQVTLLVRRIPALLMTRQKPGGCATLSSETRRQEDNPWIVFAPLPGSLPSPNAPLWWTNLPGWPPAWI